MFCEAYNKSLTDAAVTAEPLSPVLQQHLAACELCRVTFAEEQSLYASVDSALHTVANPEVPATLIPRIHVALNTEPQPKPAVSFPKWLFVGSVLAAALIVVAVLKPTRREGRPSISGASQTPVSVRSEAQPVPSLTVRSTPRSAGKPEKIELASAAVKSPFASQVLVPDEERAAFAKFLSRNNSASRAVTVTASLVPEAPKVLGPLEPVEIASLRVPSLGGEEASRAEFKQVPSASQPLREMK